MADDARDSDRILAAARQSLVEQRAGGRRGADDGSVRHPTPPRPREGQLVAVLQ